MTRTDPMKLNRPTPHAEGCPAGGCPINATSSVYLSCAMSVEKTHIPLYSQFGFVLF